MHGVDVTPDETLRGGLDGYTTVYVKGWTGSCQYVARDTVWRHCGIAVLLMVPSFTRKHRRRRVGANSPLDRMLLHMVSVFGPRA